MACDLTLTPTQCRKGSEVQLYYNVSEDLDPVANPVWVEHLGMVEDLNCNETEELTEFSTRRSDRIFKEYNEGEIELSIAGTQLHDATYEGWWYLNSARAGGTPKDCMILGGLLTEICTYGFRGSFWNSDRTLNGPAEGNLTNTVNLQPSGPCDENHIGVRTVQVDTPGTASDVDATTFTPVTRP